MEKQKWASPLEQGVSRPKDSVNDVEITTSEAVHHFRQQVGPFLREIFSSYDTDGITELVETHKDKVVAAGPHRRTELPRQLTPNLFLDLFWAAQHQIDDDFFDCCSVGLGYLVWLIFNLLDDKQSIIIRGQA